jgi:hypothetical protein
MASPNDRASDPSARAGGPKPGNGAAPGYDGMYDPLVAHNARVLDPTKAIRIGDERFDTTIYIADRLLVNSLPNGDPVNRFIDFAREQGFVVSVDEQIGCAIRTDSSRSPTSGSLQCGFNPNQDAHCGSTPGSCCRLGAPGRVPTTPTPDGSAWNT